MVAPEFPGIPEVEAGIVRVPAVQNFAGSDFSMPIAFSHPLSLELDTFRPDIIHSHHPFLLGDTALRTAAKLDLPVLFTYHTRYELYGHYVAQNSIVLKRLVLSLALGYCDLCDGLIAPSQSIARMLKDDGVKTPITVIPSGIDPTMFTDGDRARWRDFFEIPEDAFVVGHVGRLAEEKNLRYLVEALAMFLRLNPSAHVLIAGGGATEQAMKDAFATASVEPRVHFAGVATGQALEDIYAGMDVFAFSSLSETQGLVLVEAMSTGVPVVALDAPGVREVVRDGRNGRLLHADAPARKFAFTLSELMHADVEIRAAMTAAATRSAAAYTIETCLDRTLDLYGSLIDAGAVKRQGRQNTWQQARRRLSKELDIAGNVAHALGTAVLMPAGQQHG